MAPSSYVIIGAGVFGASTAYHLIKKHPEAKIRLVDRTPLNSAHGVGASWDWSKAVRADYTNELYMAKALEALEYWRKDPDFTPFYHETGIVWLDDPEFTNKVAEHYVKLNAKERFRLTNPEEVKKLYEGVFEDADYAGINSLLINESSGWAEASKALNRVVQVAVEAGVEYVATDIASLILDADGNCTGAKTASGEELIADHVVLATGAYTAKLLADSSADEKLQIGDRLVAAAICTGNAKLSPEQLKRFKNSPVFMHALDPTLGGYVPPGPEGEMKYWRDTSFKNTVEHPSGFKISVPPASTDYDQWELAQTLKDEVALVGKGILGKNGADFKLEKFRVCWDSITPTQDFIITEHPHSKHLFIATGGSFHGWKFLPIVGKYVTQLLDGELDGDLAKIWAWDRGSNGSAHAHLLPKRELRDIK